ncbi:hypothetical protein GGX14DRAFT_667038 [Mycena pura]|uniref:Zn(2)-C6 fungal-type domain-containing protein n=1 Tax=Mycena pura TaxID=153505 RepID=A0AAD6V2D7_9AGAR|nr:hypothetical protein GGX14DRAFT_667038 [Mycena pura]
MSEPRYFPTGTAAPDPADIQLSMAMAPLTAAPEAFMLHVPNGTPLNDTPAAAPPAPYDPAPPAHTRTRTLSGPPHFDFHPHAHGFDAHAHSLNADAYSCLQPWTAAPGPSPGLSPSPSPSPSPAPASAPSLPCGPLGDLPVRDDGRAPRQAPACLPCRKRKIACGRLPGAGGPTTCDQCRRPGRNPAKCVYPKETRRGHHRRIKSQLTPLAPLLPRAVS